MRITAGLVLFRTDPRVFSKAIESFLASASEGVIVVVDNSPLATSHEFWRHERVKYVFPGKNLGFGAAHNRAFQLVKGASDFHLIVNPDVEFAPNVVPALANKLQDDPSIAAVMPRIEYPDGSLQHLCKLLPTPAHLIARRFLPSKAVASMNSTYELHGLSQTEAASVPSLSGCFLLLRSHLFDACGGFDSRYFMYLEDVDLVRRIAKFGRTVYSPNVSVVHGYAKGSYRSPRLLAYHIASAVKYFNKWGWFNDRDREAQNRQMLQSIQFPKDMGDHRG